MPPNPHGYISVGAHRLKPYGVAEKAFRLMYDIQRLDARDPNPQMVLIESLERELEKFVRAMPSELWTDVRAACQMLIERLERYE